MSKNKFIHSGSVLLNLALTGKPLRGWALGTIVNLIGDKSTGKTLLSANAMNTFLGRAEKMNGKPPIGVYYDLEGSMASMEPFFTKIGYNFDDCYIVDKKEVNSVERLYADLSWLCDQCVEKDAVGFAVVDSLDALTSEADKKEKLDKGTYGMSKQKQLGRILERLAERVVESNVCILFISQVRENINAGLFGKPLRRNGGKALGHWCSQEAWLYESGKIKHPTTEMVIGINIRGYVEKTRHSASHRSVKFPILFNYGVDDITAMINFSSDKKIPIDYRMPVSSSGHYDIDGKKLRIAKVVDHYSESVENYKELLKITLNAWTGMEQANTRERRLLSELMNEL